MSTEGDKLSDGLSPANEVGQLGGWRFGHEEYSFRGRFLVWSRA